MPAIRLSRCHMRRLRRHSKSWHFDVHYMYCLSMCSGSFLLRFQRQQLVLDQYNLFYMLSCFCIRNPMTGINLLYVPLEIRRSIYLYLIPTQLHISLPQSANSIHITPCVEPDLNANLGGAERCYRSDDSIFSSRIRSSWGPHWRCEEIALGMDDESHGVGPVAARKFGNKNPTIEFTGILRACKKT
jgi:hypothetical protein